MLEKGQEVKAKITSIVNYGAFCELSEAGETAKGLIHISEISDYFVNDINDFFSVGDIVTCQVIDVIADKNQVKLSYKALRPELLKNSESKLQETGSGFDGLQNEVNKTIAEG